jgi:hypothetical protein
LQAEYWTLYPLETATSRHVGLVANRAETFSISNAITNRVAEFGVE